MSGDLNVADTFVHFRVNNGDFSKFLARILPAVTHIQKLCLWIVDNAVWTQIQLDGVNEFEGITTEDTEHPIIAAGYKYLVQCRNVGDALRLLEPGDAASPFPSLQVHNFQ